MHGGSVGVCSMANSFAAGKAAGGGDPAGRRRVLVADDNADAAETLAMLLSLLGYEVRTAADGMEAVAAAEEFRPDVAVLDIGMPRLDGNGAARRMRAEPWGAEMTIIALTGWGSDEDRRRTAEAGFDLHLTKPVDPTTLQSLIAGMGRKK